MTLEKLLQQLIKVEKNLITIDKFNTFFNKFRKKTSYLKLKEKYGNIADKLEVFNDDLSRHEPIDKLRNEYSDYYISEKQLINIIKKISKEIEIVLKEK